MQNDRHQIEELLDVVANQVNAMADTRRHRYHCFRVLRIRQQLLYDVIRLLVTLSHQTHRKRARYTQLAFKSVSDETSCLILHDFIITQLIQLHPSLVSNQSQNAPCVGRE